MNRITKQIITILLIVTCGNVFSQKRKVYRSGEGPAPSPIIKKEPVKVEPQEARKKEDEKICNCGNDLTFDPTTNIAMDKNTKGNPPYTGKCNTFFKNNKIEMQLSFVNGKQDGTWYYFYENGNPKIIKNYAEGKPHGTWTAFEEDSTVASVNNYYLGLKNGVQIFYVRGGKRKEMYVMDVKDGKFEEFYKDGTLKREVNYKNNKFDGAYLKYSKDSVLVIEQEYKDGKIEGKDNSYFENGNVAYKNFYKNEKKEGEWVFNNEDGTPYKTENYSKGKKIGIWKEFYPNGTLKTEIEYKKDKLISKKEFDKEGNLKEE